MSDQDYFSDIDLKGYGLFDGSAVNEHYSATVKPRADGRGIAVQCNCDRCGQRHGVEIDWPEVIVISMARLPPGYRHINGTIQPTVGCSSCHVQLPIGLTADECKKLVHAGIQAQRLQPELVQRIAAHVQQSR